jgi:hypothetical protein
MYQLIKHGDVTECRTHSVSFILLRMNPLSNDN